MPQYDDGLDWRRVAGELFGESGLNGVDKLFTAAGEPFEERVRLACVLLSEGDPAKLRHAILQARSDSRDVLYWAFYYNDEAPPALRRFLRAR
jgi:hypothetical protein